VHKEVTSLFKDLLLSDPSVCRLSALRRSSSLYTQGERADALFLIEDGLIKLTRTSDAGGRMILSVYGPGDLLGEESLFGDHGSYSAEAEALGPSVVYRVPWATVNKVIDTHPELSTAFVRYLLIAKECFARKVELMCLRGVEARILFYLEYLTRLVKPSAEDAGYPLPITQLELADLVGATRETTSTTLNQLEKRGIVKLSRRLLTVYLKQSYATAANGFQN
jgi:CRP/FNR family transcriptional regulator, cyclic AMP receptor protein